MYDSLSVNYDRFVNWENRLAYEMPFIEQQLKTSSNLGEIRVLDAACGTGLHVIELNRRGYKAAGADFSTPMIIKATENAKAQGISAVFKTAAFGTLANTFIKDTEDRFDALVCLGNSLPHILNETELGIALLDFKHCIQNDGLLFIQNRNFDAVMSSQNRWMEPQSFEEGNEEWIFIRFYDFQPDQRIIFNIITLHRTANQGWHQSIDSTILYPWRFSQLSTALLDAGFTEVKAYGDMTGAPFDSQQSGNLILTARAQ